ncbi:AI-2E family transporter [Microbacterium sp. bgisy203]|uniref:AI-2E family transporter n=1 Tax=Microbacterium sp. bgisy203 TaxID=3413799 RepID=UPI003D74DA90
MTRATTTTAPASRALSPTLSALLGLAAAVLVLAGVYLAREIIGPLALAAVIVIICEPVRRPLERRGWPRWAATTAVIAVAYLVLAAMAAMLAYSGTAFVGLVRDSADDLRATADQLVAWLGSLGLQDQASDAAASLLDPATLVSFATSLGSSALGVVTAFFFVLAYVIFMAVDDARYTRAEERFGARVTPFVRRAESYNRSVRRYYVVNASFGLVVAVIDGLALWALGIPVPVVWAILAFVTNFIPNIGFILGLVPPALLALVVGGWPLMLVVIGIYCVVNVTLQVMIQPKFVSDAVDLTLTLSFFSVVFWTFIIGPLGALLSIPLTLLVRELLFGGDPKAWFARWLSGDDDAAPPREVGTA